MLDHRGTEQKMIAVFRYGVGSAVFYMRRVRKLFKGGKGLFRIPKLHDVILNHIIELNLEEVSGSTGMYWLKEELLYRLNLAATPVKIKKLNFSIFELQK